MEFILPFKITQPQRLINLNQPIVLTGSCFTQHIYQKLAQHFVPAVGQPQGVVYNPLQLFNGINRAVQNKRYQSTELFEFNGMWHSWQHHSAFNQPAQQSALQLMNDALQQTHEAITKPNGVVFITLGSAWIYEKDGKGVANCHKYPQQVFTKRLLRADEIMKGFEAMISQLNHAQIILTVSPVKHVKDGLFENNVSKGVLLNACYQLAQKYPQQVYYFPVYELVTDVLRDYRFFATDLVHPSQMAIDYVWQKLVEVCLTDDAKLFLKEANQVYLQTQHKILFPQSAEAALFTQNKQTQIAKFIQRYPWAIQPK